MRRVTDAQPVSLAELRQMLGRRFSDLVINLYPELPETDWLEFDSMINLRPSFGNRSRGVDDAATQDAIAGLVKRLVTR